LGYGAATLTAARLSASDGFTVELRLGVRALTILVPAAAFYRSTAWFRETYLDPAAAMFYAAGVPDTSLRTKRETQGESALRRAVAKFTRPAPSHTTTGNVPGT
jgi:hypothetical protein